MKYAICFLLNWLLTSFCYAQLVSENANLEEGQYSDTIVVKRDNIDRLAYRRDHSLITKISGYKNGEQFSKVEVELAYPKRVREIVFELDSEGKNRISRIREEMPYDSIIINWYEIEIGSNTITWGRNYQGGNSYAEAYIKEALKIDYVGLLNKGKIVQTPKTLFFEGRLLEDDVLLYIWKALRRGEWHSPAGLKRIAGTPLANAAPNVPSPSFNKYPQQLQKLFIFEKSTTFL